MKVIKNKSIFRDAFKMLFPFTDLRRSIAKKILAMNEKEIPESIALDSKMRQKLFDLYAFENKRLSEFMGRDLDHWK